jgi:hypothetical protein
MAEALLAWTANKKAAADAASKPAAAAAAAASDVDSAGSSSNSSSAAYISDSSESSSSSSSQAHPEIGHSADSLPQPAVASSSSNSDGADEQARSLPAGMSPPWMINNPDPPLPLPLARCKDALLMAQVCTPLCCHYLCSYSTAGCCSRTCWSPVKPRLGILCCLQSLSCVFELLTEFA